MKAASLLGLGQPLPLISRRRAYLNSASLAHVHGRTTQGQKALAQSTRSKKWRLTFEWARCGYREHSCGHRQRRLCRRI
jgi:hypothetical protein